MPGNAEVGRRQSLPISRSNTNNNDNNTHDDNNNNNAELTYMEDNRERLLRFHGTVDGHPAWILLDSGASRNFIDEKFVQRNRLVAREIKPITVEMADGRK